MEYSIIKSPNLTLTEAILNVHTTLKDNRGTNSEFTWDV